MKSAGDKTVAGSVIDSTAANYHALRRARNRRAFLLLAAPAVIWFIALMIWPTINMFYVSTLRWRGVVEPKEAVGLANYVRLLTQDPAFRDAVINTTKHMIIGLPGAIVPAFILGFFLSQRPPGYRVLRVVFFAPCMISAAGAAMMFKGVFMPDGIVDSALNALGLGELTRSWLRDPATAFYSVIAVDMWTSIGYQSVLFFAALSGVPPDLYEAARLDGASYWTMMWRVAFPLVLDLVGVSMTMRTMWILLGSAQTVVILTGGGPGNASLTLGYFLYREAFLSRRLGYSQAIGVILLVVGMILIMIIRRATRRSYQM